jgi:hypothetical protein
MGDKSNVTSGSEHNFDNDDEGDSSTDTFHAAGIYFSWNNKC